MELLAPELALLEPELALLEPELALLDPELALLEPELALLEPELALLDPLLALFDPELLALLAPELAFGELGVPELPGLAGGSALGGPPDVLGWPLDGPDEPLSGVVGGGPPEELSLLPLPLVPLITSEDRVMLVPIALASPIAASTTPPANIASNSAYSDALAPLRSRHKARNVAPRIIIAMMLQERA